MMLDTRGVVRQEEKMALLFPSPSSVQMKTLDARLAMPLKFEACRVNPFKNDNTKVVIERSYPKVMLAILEAL